VKQSEKKHWDRFWERSGEVEEVYSNEGRVSERLAALVALEGKQVLEVGAGTGRDGILLSHGGATVVSLDYSIRSLSMIQSQVGANGTVLPACGDAFELPFQDATFDIVFHQGLLEHFRNPDDLIAENARVLKRGGILLVDVPQKYHYYTLIKHIMIPLGLWFAGWETEYSVAELEKLLARHSLTIISSYGEWFNPPIWYRMLRKALLPARIRLPMHPLFFAFMDRFIAPIRSYVLGRRWGLYTALVIGTIARKDGKDA
jgi:SAM-dependent methyltransferase